MKTQLKLNIDDELFDKAAEEALRAKITELVRKDIDELTDEKVAEAEAKSIERINHHIEKAISAKFARDEYKLREDIDKVLHAKIRNQILYDFVDDNGHLSASAQKKVQNIIDNMTEKAVNELISDRIDAAITVAIDKLVKKKVFEILGLERETGQKDDLEEH